MRAASDRGYTVYTHMYIHTCTYTHNYVHTHIMYIHTHTRIITSGFHIIIAERLSVRRIILQHRRSNLS